ncbi:MAG TPA: glycosyltransferase family 39 protein [Thermoflexus sp.]|nr:glycosyltransferase family 39 protein [Thermoflexus sp.]
MKGDRTQAGSALMIGSAGFLAVLAQLRLDHSPREVPDPWGLALYAWAMVLLVWALARTPAWLAVEHPLREAVPDPPTVRWPWLGLSVGLMLLAFLDSGGNRFRLPGVIAWALSVIAWFVAWWNRPLPRVPWDGFLVRGHHWLLLLLLGLGIGFRYWDLWNLPLDVNSDHAEKLLDVRDVLNGEYRIFFPRNTGREAFQFYLAAATARLFGMPLHKFTLQVGTAFIGVLLLPAMYLLGKALWGRHGGIWAMLLSAVASWAVIPSRVGLRYPFLPTFAAWSLAFLVRGLRTGRRVDFLWMGFFLGVGLYGYSPFRGMLAALPAAFLVVWLAQRGWRTPEGWRRAGDFLIGMLTALPVLAPMLRFIVDFPEVFFYRLMTRVSTWEKPIEGNPLLILMDNIRRALLMFHWTGDEVYVATIPLRPMLDPVLGALLFLGGVAAWLWMFHHRDPVPLAGLVAGFVMLLPSAYNLTFPRENPSTVRAAGALPTVLAFAALVPALWTEGWSRIGASGRRWIGLGMAALMAVTLIRLNADRIFQEYARIYCQIALNASDAAEILRGFYAGGGPEANAFYVAYPYWFDSRLIGMWLGDLDWPYTVWYEDLPQAVEAHRRLPGPKLYLVHPEDQGSLAVLQAAYPQGWWVLRPRTHCEGLGILVFHAPPGPF